MNPVHIGSVHRQLRRLQEMGDGNCRPPASGLGALLGAMILLGAITCAAISAYQCGTAVYEGGDAQSEAD